VTTSSNQQPRILSDAEYDRLTPAQRLGYAQSHDQRRFNPDAPVKSKEPER